MLKRTLPIFLIAVLLAVTCVVPRQVQANPITIGANLLKGAARGIASSFLVKTGVRTAEREAIEKASYGLWTRFEKSEIAKLEQALQRSIPLDDKPGWVKTAVSIGLFATGADIVLDIYNTIVGNEPVMSYVPFDYQKYGYFISGAGTAVENRLLGEYYYAGTTYQKFEQYVLGNYLTVFSISKSAPIELLYKWVEGTCFRNYVEVGCLLLYEDRYNYTTGQIERSTRIYDIAHAELAGMNTDSLAKYQKLSFSPTELTYTPVSEVVTVPNWMPDIWEGDRVVEIVIPDPALTDNPFDKVFENQDFVANPDLPIPADPPATGDIVARLDDIKTRVDAVNDAIGGLQGDIAGVREGIEANTRVQERVETNTRTIADVLTTGLVGDLNINYQPLLQSGHTFTTKFPFSIPWDIARAFEAVFGGMTNTEPPTFTWNYKGTTMHIEFPDVIKGWLPIVRAMILVIFDIGIIYSVRKWLGGAS